MIIFCSRSSSRSRIRPICALALSLSRFLLVLIGSGVCGGAERLRLARAEAVAAACSSGIVRAKFFMIAQLAYVLNLLPRA